MKLSGTPIADAEVFFCLARPYFTPFTSFSEVLCYSPSLNKIASESISQKSLLGLPIEIQARIVSFLTAPTSFKPVNSVLSTCEQLHHIALPFSAHTYRNVDRGFGLKRKSRSRGRNLQFLRYITINKSQLAQYVKTLVVGDFTTVTEDNEEHADA